MVFNNNTLITVTEHDADSTTWHVFEDKGRKIMVKFDLDEPRCTPALLEEPQSQLESPPMPHTEAQTGLGPQCEQQSQPQSESELQPEPFPEVNCAVEESRSGPMLPAEPEPQSTPKGHIGAQAELGEEQSMPKPQSVPPSEAQSEIEDALKPKSQPETQPDPLHERVKQVTHAAGEAVEMESIRDRLGASVTYLEELLKIGDVLKDVSRLFQIRPRTDHKYSRRSTRSSAFP